MEGIKNIVKYVVNFVINVLQFVLDVAIYLTNVLPQALKWLKELLAKLELM